MKPADDFHEYLQLADDFCEYLRMLTDVMRSHWAIAGYFILHLTLPMYARLRMLFAHHVPSRKHRRIRVRHVEHLAECSHTVIVLHTKCKAMHFRGAVEDGTT